MKSLTVPGTLTSIGEYAFNGCTSLGGDLGGADEGVLGTLTIEEGIGIISKSMFSNCTALTSVTIPTSVREIGESSFSGCTALASVTFTNPQGSQCVKIGAYAFYACGLASIGGTGSAAMPLWMRTIGERAFARNSNLASAVLPDGLEPPNPNIFEGCQNLAAHTGYGGYGYVGNWIFVDKASA
jgi:hypothetical protein